MNEELSTLMKSLAAPFNPSEVKWKPQAVSGNRCMAICYVDARLVQDRLDRILGVENWKDEYECLPDGSVVCRLSLRLGNEWILKTDVGAPSEQPDEGDRRKAAFSDALKRAAVKFGIGRYLYKLGTTWVDYDPQKKRMLAVPELPPWALPEGYQAKGAERPARSAGKTPPRKGPVPSNLPADGPELKRRLYDFDRKLADQKSIQHGDLIQHVVAAGKARGYDADLAQWEGPAIAFAAETAKQFRAGLGRRAAEKPPERPYDTDMDDAELIDSAMQTYLAWLIRDRGFNVAKSLAKRGLERLEDMDVGLYRFMCDNFEPMPTGAGRRVPERAGSEGKVPA